MIVPHVVSNLLSAALWAAGDEATPSPSKSKKKGDADPSPSGSESGGTSGGSDSNPFGDILDFLISNPWIPGILVAIVGINIGWRKLTERQNLNGQALPPLGNLISRTLRLALKEDKTPVLMRPQKLAARMRWLTWQRYWFLAVGFAIFDISAFSGIIPDQFEIVFTALIVLMILSGVQHVRVIFKRRHRILMQMFEVAAAECKYPKGAELNPWGWIQISRWNGLYAPAGTYVVFPPRFRSEDEGVQQAFERNFNGTVSSEHTWMYTWESANNRVLCEPVPFITDQAPYPFPDEHPWNEFPLGISAGGKEAVVDVAVFPHLLVAGTTGSGKSVTQRTLLLHALQSPEWRVSLIDPKRVELSAYTNHRNVVKVATELDESVALLEGVEQEMQSRYKRMEKEGVNHFKRLSTPPPALLLMVDELFALLSPENIKSDEGKERDELHARATVIIGSIARLGRASGVHMILATQRPDAKVLPGETKALAIDTPILTSAGWKTVETIQPGDYVFAPDGTQTIVTGVTDIMRDHQCYELEFSDGSRITADAGHLWVTEDAAYRGRLARARKRAAQRGSRPLTPVEQKWARALEDERQPITTECIARTTIYHGKSNHSIPIAAALKYPTAQLPVDPYLLGVWLGDGSTGTTNVTGIDEEIFENIRAAGYHVWPNREKREQLWRISESAEKANRWNPGLKGRLRDLEVLQRKHIPQAYKMADEQQRRALLAGLLDTDGTVGERHARRNRSTAPAGQVLLRLTSRELAHDAHELILGLGYQATIREGIASYVLNGQRNITGPVWTIAFTPHEPVFRLSRKVHKQNLEGTTPRGTTQRRYITQIRQVPSVPVKCIAVEHPSHQFLAGRTLIATHNSNLDCRIAQGRMDTTPSLMVLDSEAATRIPKIRGRAMVRMGGDITEFQAYFLPEDALMQVLEMSEALASQQMTVQDFKDLIEQARADQGTGTKRRLPRVPVPKGLANRTSAWVEKRKQAVERNEEEGKRFASSKTRGDKADRTSDPTPQDPPMRDLPGNEPEAAASGRGARRLLGRRRGGEPGLPSELGRPDATATYAEAEAEGEVRHEGVHHGEARYGGDSFDDEAASYAASYDDTLAAAHSPYDALEERDSAIDYGAYPEDAYEPYSAEEVPHGRGRDIEDRSLSVGAVDEAFLDDEDDDIELILEAEEDLPVSDLDDDDEDFLDDVMDAVPAPRRTPAAPLPSVPSRAPESEDPGLVAQPAAVPATPSVSTPAPLQEAPMEVAAESLLPLAVEADEAEEDIFADVMEAPWMPDVIPGSTSGPSPFGGGEVAQPTAPPPAAAAMADDEDDDEDEPFI